ncbi:CorA family divalent cation transporter [Streptococcus oralis]|uniref:CorA family divalent cation transporter n=1 Tax=Streptococcus oralis TaxID=1303 RepID=UPI001F50A230|nr:CorA family divalent cation transporter [Streptococcus oralis]
MIFDEYKRLKHYLFTFSDLKLLYSILYIDKGGSTCLSRDMLKAELEQLLYTRWSGDGSLYMASQHSMIFMSYSDFPEFFLKGYFLSEYLDLALITLSQRIGILKYSKDAGDSVNATVSQKLKLQKSYTTYKNQFLLPELCPQEQAVEIYELLQKSLYIEKHISILDSQISELHDISQTEASNNLNVIVLIFTVLSVFLAVIPNIKEFGENCATFGGITLALSSWFTIVVSVALLLIAYFYIKKQK